MKFHAWRSDGVLRLISSHCKRRHWRRPAIAGRLVNEFDSLSESLMFDIRFTDHALHDLQTFPEAERQWILTALELQLMVNAAEESRDRRRIRPDMLAEWAVRLGEVRVFYDVDIPNRTVKVAAVGKRMVV